MNEMKAQRKRAVVFSHDKRGRKIAFYVGRSDYRLFRMRLADAEFDVATGAAFDETAGWVDYFARLKADREAQR